MLDRSSIVRGSLFQSEQMLVRLRGRFLFKALKCSANKASKILAFLLLLQR
jgi:hypothetical protein